MIAACRAWEERRDKLDFEIDGVVVKINDFGLQQELGVVGREPRWAIAFKFSPTTAVTRLRSIEVNVGRTGNMIPFALLEPVEVGGVTVSKATLHNEEDVARKDIRAGDEVVVMRAGDVIPQVVSPVTQRRDGSERPYKPPARCPACGTKTVKPEGEVWTRCPNRKDCPGQILQTIGHFVSRGAMDIEGYGDKLVLRFYQEGLVRSLPDIYRLDADRLESLEGFQRRSAENLVRAIEGSKSQPFHRVLYALGIPGIGSVNARALARHFGSIDRLMDAGPEQVEEAPGHRARAGGHDRRDVRREAKPHAGGRTAGGRFELRGRGGPHAAGARPARRQDLRPHRDATHPDPRGGNRADNGPGREGDRIRIGQDRLRGGRGGARYEVGKSQRSGKAGLG